MFKRRSSATKPIIAIKDKKKKKLGFLGFVKLCFFWSFVLTIIGAVAGFFVYKLASDPYKKWAEEIDISEDEINRLKAPDLIYDRKGKVIGRIFEENRSYVKFEKIGQPIVKALVAQEDSRFWQHKGVDYIGIARAAYLNFKSGEADSGASSITQQLARNAFDLKQRSIERGESSIGRKVVEMFLAQRIERHYSKEQILEFYLNRIYLGSGFYGIRSASLGYFGKEPADLTMREAASIAALIKNPNGISPLNHPEQNLKWRNHVLNRLKLEGELSEEACANMQKMPLGLNPKPLERGVSHFYERVGNDMRAFLGEENMARGGYHIYTTIDSDVQKQAEESLRQELLNIENTDRYAHQKFTDYTPKEGVKPQYLEGAVLMTNNETGAVLAYVGGRDFSKRQFDCIGASRPMGTAYLPFVYAAGFENSEHPAVRVMDEPIDNRMVGVGGSEGILSEWGPESHENQYEGEISARRALEQSKIAASIRFGRQVGIDKVLQLHGRLGLPPVEAAADGSYLPRSFVGFDLASLQDLVRAYSVIFNQGKVVDGLYYIDRIEDSQGRLVYEAPQARKIYQHQKVMDPATAYQVQDVLAGSILRGTSKAGAKDLSSQFQGGGKTGTTHEFSDLWYLGGNAKITCGVWVGFLEGRKPIYQGAFSRVHAQPVWNKAINSAMADFSAPISPPPSPLQAASICRVSGGLATAHCYEMTDPENGEGPQTMKPSSFKEMLTPAQRQKLSICTHHGPGKSWETDIRLVAPDGNSEKSRVLPIPAVMVKTPVLVGNDPYQTERLVNTPQTPDFYQQGVERAVKPIIVGMPSELGDEDAQIRLPMPNRIRIDFSDL